MSAWRKNNSVLQIKSKTVLLEKWGIGLAFSKKQRALQYGVAESTRVRSHPHKGNVFFPVLLCSSSPQEKFHEQTNFCTIGLPYHRGTPENNLQWIPLEFFGLLGIQVLIYHLNSTQVLPGSTIAKARCLWKLPWKEKKAVPESPYVVMRYTSRIMLSTPLPPSLYCI